MASFLHRFFDAVFGGVLGAFWPPFGRHFGVILVTFSVQEVTRSEKVDFQKNLIKPVVFLMILRVGGTQMTPFWVPEATFGTSKNDVDFCIDF